MRILGIDWGQNKFGLAIAEDTLAEPYKVFKVNSPKEALHIIAKIVKDEEIERVVVGISEEQSGKNAGEFSLSLKNILQIPVENFDETLSTYEANRLATQAGTKTKRRKKMEDAYAAAILLQDYIDTNRNE